MKTAKYARQSVEKHDSVSIEAQFEKCELICILNNCDSVEFSDVGYSGSNINRPGFERLIDDIKQGRINRVISYTVSAEALQILQTCYSYLKSTMCNT